MRIQACTRKVTLYTKNYPTIMKENTIEDFNFKLICEYFSLIPRQGPGNEQTTLKALSFINDNFDETSRIIDIGCGTGMQTITLAQNINGNIEAIDLFPRFIEMLNKRLEQMNLQNRCKAIVGDMTKLQIQEESADLIWSEGAIYNIGFKKGLHKWRRFLKRGGYIAVSEVIWFTEQRPKEVEDFWKVYPEIDTIGNKIKQMENEGYETVAVFRIPDCCWTTSFYAPQKKAREIIMRKYPQNECVQNLVNCMKHEEEIFNRYHKYYGYAFFIGRKL